MNSQLASYCTAQLNVLNREKALMDSVLYVSN